MLTHPSFASKVQITFVAFHLAFLVPQKMLNLVKE